MHLAEIAKFMKESGLRKIGAGLYMFTFLSYMRMIGGLTPDEFKPLVLVLVCTLMGANAYEHHVNTRAAGKEEPDAPDPASPAAPAAASPAPKA